MVVCVCVSLAIGWLSFMTEQNLPVINDFFYSSLVAFTVADAPVENLLDCSHYSLLYVYMEGYTLFCTGKYELCGSTAILHCCLPVSAQSYLFVEVYTLHTLSVSVRIFLKMCDCVCVVKSNANETETVETAQEF